MQYPVGPELEIVTLLKTIAPLARKCGQDHVLREGVASLVEGAWVLLNDDWGRRLDMDECRSQLRNVAALIGYDIDTERFRDNRIVDADFWSPR